LLERAARSGSEEGRARRRGRGRGEGGPEEVLEREREVFFLGFSDHPILYPVLICVQLAFLTTDLTDLELFEAVLNRNPLYIKLNQLEKEYQET